MIDLVPIANRASAVIVDALPDNVRVPLVPDAVDGPYGNAINSEYVPVLADLLQLVMANVIASILDAGSEREAVIEDENLTEAILTQLKEWTT